MWSPQVLSKTTCWTALRFTQRWHQLLRLITGHMATRTPHGSRYFEGETNELRTRGKGTRRFPGLWRWKSCRCAQGSYVSKGDTKVIKCDKVSVVDTFESWKWLAAKLGHNNVQWILHISLIFLRSFPCAWRKEILNFHRSSCGGSNHFFGRMTILLHLSLLSNHSPNRIHKA